jgi:WD40 repeat protein
MDHRLILWDISAYKLRGELIGHTQGIRSIIYSKEHDTLITSGFEFDAYAWDIGSRHQLFTMKGHRGTIIQSVFLKLESEYCITVDEFNVFKIWDIARGGPSSSGIGMCLQTFYANCDIGVSAPRCMAVTGHDATLIVGAFRMKLFSCERVANVDDQLVTALFNDVTHSFITVMGSKVTIYNATDGSIRNQFEKIVTNSEITCCCLDDRKRKFILGTSTGEILVYNYLNGVFMKDGPQHTNTVVDLVYNDEDRCLLSCSWDRSIKVLDEDPAERLQLLRSIERAHDRDISAMAFSRNLGFIATGSADFTVRLFDFSFAKLVAVLCGHRSEITKLIFYEDYYLLISADCTGNIIFWDMQKPYKKIGELHHLSRVSESDFELNKNTKFEVEGLGHSNDTFITTMRGKEIKPKKERFQQKQDKQIVEQKVYVPICCIEGAIMKENSSHILLVGDERGEVRIYNLNFFLFTNEVDFVDAAKSACNQAGYNYHFRTTTVIDPREAAKRSSEEMNVKLGVRLLLALIL